MTTTNIFNQPLKSRTVAHMSNRLKEVSNENWTTVLYEVEENQNFPIDLTIEYQTTDGLMIKSFTIEENNATRYSTKMAVRNGLLLDVNGVSNKVFYTAE